MIRRARFASGLILLAALSLSIVEAVSASMCGPEMNEQNAGSGASADDMGGMPMDHACPPGHRHAAPDEPGDPGPCPFALPGTAQGCASSASLPAVAVIAELFSLEGVVLEAPADVSPTFLEITSIFRPPKA